MLPTSPYISVHSHFTAPANNSKGAEGDAGDAVNQSPNILGRAFEDLWSHAARLFTYVFDSELPVREVFSILNGNP